jgi:hypothetical protein
MPKNIGPSLAPLLLRLSLGLTFVWAGLGKIEATFAVKGDQAVLLASMGVDKVRAAAASGKTVVPQVPEVSKPAPTKDTSPLPVGPNAPALTPPSPQPGTISSRSATSTKATKSVGRRLMSSGAPTA